MAEGVGFAAELSKKRPGRARRPGWEWMPERKRGSRRSHSDQSSSAVTLKSHGEPIDSGQGQKYPHINRMEDFAWVKSLQPKTLLQPVELQRGTGA